MDQNIDVGKSSNCKNVETKIQNEETPTTSHNQQNPCYQVNYFADNIVVTRVTNSKVDGSTIGQILEDTSPRKCKRKQQDSSEAGPSRKHGNDSNPGTVESIDGKFRKCLDDQNFEILEKHKNTPVPLDVSKETMLTSEEFGDTPRQDFEKKENLQKAHIGRLLPSELNTNNEDCFKLFSSAFESRDDSITRSVADALPKKIKISGRSPIQQSDAMSFCYVLRSTSRQITINITVQFFGDGLKMLLKMVTETSHKIGMLEISGNKLDEDSLVSMATCVHKIEALHLFDCEIGGRKIKILTDAIARRETPIGILDISGNKLDEDSLVSMATCVHKIEKLILWKCEIGGRKIKVLTDAIARRETPIGKLNISRNKLDEDSLVSMATCVHKIEELFLIGCEIGGRKIKVLTDAIARRETPIGGLGISENKLDEDSLVSMATCVHKIEKLILWKCEIGGRKIKVLTDAIARRETPIKFLNVTFNPLGDEGLKFLLQSFHKIDELECDCCDFTSAGKKELKRAKKLKVRNSLNYSHNYNL